MGTAATSYSLAEVRAMAEVRDQQRAEEVPWFLNIDRTKGWWRAAEVQCSRSRRCLDLHQGFRAWSLQQALSI